MDAFFASVEQLDNPELKGKPVAVGGSRERGVVAAASYEAREYGVRSAMPSTTAYRKCPHIVFVKPRFDRYKEISNQIREIFYSYTELVEPLSLDEAYLDVTSNKQQLKSAIRIAKNIKKEIREKTGLTASAGVSINKFIAKVASDMDKPDGLTVVLPEDAEEFVENLPIEKFYGVGKVTAEKMKKLGITNGADLKNWDRVQLIRQFGKMGKYFYSIARAEDNREVSPDRPYKSVSSESTYRKDLVEEKQILQALDILCDQVIKRLEKVGTSGRTVTLKVRFEDFKTITRSKSVADKVQGKQQLFDLIKELYYNLDEPVPPIRLFGVGVSNFDTPQTDDDSAQLTLNF